MLVGQKWPMGQHFNSHELHAISTSLLFLFHSENVGRMKEHRRQSLGGWGSPTPRFWNGGVMGSPRNIIISYNVQEYKMKTLFKMANFHKYNDLCIIKQKFC